MTNPASPGGDERPPPAYETTERLEPTPAFDALAAEVPLTEPVGGGASSLAPEADYALAPSPSGAGPLAQVKAFAAEKPAVFLGAALAAGWLLGKITSRGKRRSASDDD
ncbi:MAG TPA: hypothetical protein VH573_00025 [Mycobacteriales bacterium]|jgi:hypothetical protein